MLFHEILDVCNNKTQLVKLLVSLGILREEILCPSCLKMIKINYNTFKFRCNKTYHDIDGNVKRCYTTKTCTVNSFFHKSKVDLKNWGRFLTYKIFLKPKQSFLVKHLKLSTKTIVKMNNAFRLICLIDYERNFQPMGGIGSVVEVDESRFGPGDSSKRSKKGFWVLGGLERNTKRKFAIIVNNRNSTTLTDSIKRFVAPGTTIFTDGWRGYSKLNKEGFHHETVNHTYNYVDPDTGTHTNGVERMWGTIKAHIPIGRRHKEKFHLYFAEYLLYQHKEEDARISAIIGGLKKIKKGDLGRLPK